MQFVLGLAELAAAIVVAALSTWVAVRGLMAATRGLDEHLELREGNIAVGVVVAGAFIAAASVAHSSVRPLMAALDVTLRTELTLSGIGRWLLSAGGVALVDILLGLLSIATAWTLCRALLVADIIEQLRSRNLAVAVALGALLVVVGLLVAQGQGALVEAILPHPNTATIRLWEP